MPNIEDILSDERVAAFADKVANADEKQIEAIAAAFVSMGAGLAYRRYLRRTLVAFGVNPVAAKRVPTALGAAAFIAGTAVFSAKRIHDQLYPSK